MSEITSNRRSYLELGCIFYTRLTHCFPNTVLMLLLCAMARKKKFTLQNVLVEKYAAEGKCIARQDDKIIFVEGAVPGDYADLFVYKSKKDYAEARVNQIVTPSAYRVPSFCKHFGICGGCKWQMLPYELQLKYKEEQVKDQLQRIGRVEVEEYLPIAGAELQQWYRNKLEFTFSNKRYLTSSELNTDISSEQNVLGFHAPKLFDKIIDIDTCHLQPEPSNEIKNFVRDFAHAHAYTFYDIRLHTGLLRNLMIRVARSGQVLVNVVFGEADMEKIGKLLDALKSNFEIHSLHYTINTKLNDSIYDQDVIHYHGTTTIEEQLEEFRFDISPKSFFQTNTAQAETLYQITRRFADCKTDDVLYDLYCGTGSIGIFLSKGIGKIIGVESVADAVEDAKANARKNNIDNAEFFAGDVIKICNDSFFEKHGRPDVIIIDPPRAGCHDALLTKLLEIEAPKIVYVSCNPATQARDLQTLSSKYRVTLSQAVDMFPHTHHVENVVQLIKKSMP